jgi:hypothetical protein
MLIEGKRLTNTPVRQAGSVLKCPDDRKNRVVSAQATYKSRSSAVSGGIQEQRFAAERVLPESRFELQHAGLEKGRFTWPQSGDAQGRVVLSHVLPVELSDTTACAWFWLNRSHPTTLPHEVLGCLNVLIDSGSFSLCRFV